MPLQVQPCLGRPCVLTRIGAIHVPPRPCSRYHRPPIKTTKNTSSIPNKTTKPQASIDEALEMACSNGRLEVVKYLLALGAEGCAPIGRASLPAMIIAAQAGAVPVMKYLHSKLDLDVRELGDVERESVGEKEKE